MISFIAKSIAARLPNSWQQGLKRAHFRRQIHRNSFRTPEPEWEMVGQWLKPGEWAVDVGANVGHYTKQFSDIAGPQGRVLAFEPVPATFELLSANVSQFKHANVTLLNLAASDATQVLGMSMPSFQSGLKNYYQAALTQSGDGLQVMTCSLDGLALPHRVALLKIDAEGHDDVVLRGAAALLRRDHPVLIIESVSPEIASFLESLGYQGRTVPGSPNQVFSKAG